MAKYDDNAKLMHWSALTMAAVALAISVAAYVEANNSLEATLENQWQNLSMETREELVEARVEMRLLALRARLAAGETIQNIDEEMADIRTDLVQTYQTTEAITEAQLQELETNLDNLEDQLRNDSAEALGTVDVLITNLRQDIRTDQEEPQNQ